MVCPDDAWTGLTPHSAAKEASERIRSGLSPAATNRTAAVSGPTPGAASRAGFAVGAETPDLGFEFCDLGVEGPIAAGQMAQRLLRVRDGAACFTRTQAGADPDQGAQVETRAAGVSPLRGR